MSDRFNEKSEWLGRLMEVIGEGLWYWFLAIIAGFLWMILEAIFSVREDDE